MGDLMFLTAGVAAGFAWSRAAHFEWGMILSGGNPFIFSTQSAWHRVTKEYLYELSPFLASMTIALFVCSTRRPRPRLARLVRQPGVIGLAAVALFLAWDVGMQWAGPLLLELLDQAFGEGPGLRQSLGFYPFANQVTGKVGDSGLVIASCWLTLWISGRWRPEPSWIDRSGRLLGTYWVAVYVFKTTDAHAF